MGCFFAPFLILAGLLTFSGCYLLLAEPTSYAFLITSVGVVILGWMVQAWSGGFRDSKIARIVPYFSQELKLEEIFLTFHRGEALARYCRELDMLCVERNVRTLSSFGFGDEAKRQPQVWHAATDGLRTVNALLESLPFATDPLDSETMMEDLRRLRQVLEMAASREVDFCFHLRQGADNTMSFMEFDQRRGFYW